jgi:hypothetical protein
VHYYYWNFGHTIVESEKIISGGKEKEPTKGNPGD